MKIVVAGSSGFLGTALRRSLATQGHDLIRLVRRPGGAADESTWDPYANFVDQGLIDEADVVINLAGSPTAGNPHSKKWARQLRESRVTTTSVLADAVARSVKAGGSTAFLAGNGISYYGDHGDEVVREGADSRGDALLTEVTRDWQAAADPAIEAGARVCLLRTSPVIDRANPPLKQLLPLSKLGLGTRLGDGRQYFPIISLRDWVGAVSHLTTDAESSGAFNLCCPRVPTNREFTEALASAVGRPAFLAAPAPFLKVAAGRMAPEILGSLRAEPAAMVEAGYTFQDDDVHQIIATALKR